VPHFKSYPLDSEFLYWTLPWTGMLEAVEQ